MTEERVPQLGGRQFATPPDWFNLPPLSVSRQEPVLSGEESRVLTDRRVAYLRRDFHSLLAAMSEQQLFNMRLWQIGVALRHCRRAVRLAEEYNIDCDRMYSSLGMVAARLADPAGLSQRGYRVAVFSHSIDRWIIDIQPYTLSDAVNNLLRAASSEDALRALLQASYAYYFARQTILTLQGETFKPWIDWGARAYQRAQFRAAYTILNTPYISAEDPQTA